MSRVKVIMEYDKAGNSIYHGDQFVGILTGTLQPVEVADSLGVSIDDLIKLRQEFTGEEIIELQRKGLI
ncbi:MAG: hypothetical protein L3J79_05885 [Candidatus Marinimicrobia bacterium]|nr:hypothetical protein [Candidatus Neomarinimicrobiota bacterium]